MIIKGIAHDPKRLNERKDLPSSELVYLAVKALKEYKATHLITTLSLGWEQALAEAAIELRLPYTVAIPHPGRDSQLSQEARVLYLDLISRAADVLRISDSPSETSVMDCHCWCVDNADLTLALWDFEFEGEVFEVIDYALKKDRTVYNLWNDWEPLYRLRRQPRYTPAANRERGAQVFG